MVVHYLVRVNVPVEYRKAGIGRLLLSDVLIEADKHKINMYLEVYSSGWMSNEELSEWYKRYGFVFTGEDWVMMRKHHANTYHLEKR